MYYRPGSHRSEHVHIQCVVNCAVPVANHRAMRGGQIRLAVLQIVRHKAGDVAVVFQTNNDVDDR